MQVETFECQETAAEPIEAAEEAIAIIEQLGLSGQKSLISAGDKLATRCPYRQMRRDEDFAYGVLCPEKTRLCDYDASPVPLRVLQIAAHAQSLEMFTDLRVWHAKETAEKDPVLVGVAKHPTRSWDSTTYILARWGEELESWPVLLRRALDKKREQITEAYRAIEAKVRNARAAEEMTADELIEKGPDYQPTIHV
jgi:hypothetical protein